ncbi:MAG: MMPL family transporter [Marinilabiliaceae bacterium]|nr:MMPL family transporter [Marinilabiliaceae bacterium]
MWTWIARVILRNRIAFIIILAIITAFMGYNAQKIEMSYQYSSLLPKEDSTYIEFEKFVKLFGNESNLMVLGVENNHFFDIENFKGWQELSKELKKIEGVTSVLSVAQSYNLHKNSKEKKFEIRPIFPDTIKNQTQLDSLAKKFHELPFYKNLLYNKQTDAYLMAITLDKKILGSNQRVSMIKNIKAIGDQYSQKNNQIIHYSGLPYIRVSTAEMIKGELNMFIILALVVTAIIIFIFFRSFKVVLFSMLVVGVSVIWALGIQALFGYKITILTGMIPPLLIVIGIPNTVFLLNKYHHEYKLHGNQIKSLQRVIRKIGNATFLTNLTTALGFGTFVFTSSRILVEFGIVASINIMGIFIISILLIPIIFSLLAPPEEKHIKHLDRIFISKVLSKLVHITLSHRNLVYIIAGLIVVIGIIGIVKIKTTGYMLDDIPPKDPLYVDLKFFEKNFEGLMPLEILLDTKKPNGIIKSSTLKKMDKLESKISKFDDISQPLSLTQVVKFAKQSFYNGNEKYYTLPSNQERNFILSYVSKSGKTQSDLIASFIDSTKQHARMSFRVKDVGTTKMDSLYNEIKKIAESIFPSDKYNVSITGASIVSFKGTSYLIRNLIISVLLAIGIIASFMALMFNSKRMVLVSLIPNIIPLILTAALMGYIGIPIKPSTILVFSIAFGISVDGTIHFLAKYRQELNETNWSIKAAVVLAVKETGVSMIYTAIILFFGFAIFSTSHFGGTVALGALVAFTLLIALFSNLILLPSILLTMEKNITNRSFKEPLLEIYNEDEDIELEELKIEKKEPVEIQQ